jgi:hypothetical protein
MALCMNLCCSFNNQFPINKLISREERKRLKRHVYAFVVTVMVMIEGSM